ncbi:MAG: ABC transporter ATP-binding protein [Geminicoccaceae bacterium]
MFAWFENLIDVFKPAPIVRPPATLSGFYWHYTKQVWPTLVVVLAVGFVGALIEVSLFRYLGEIVDLVKDAGSPAAFFDEHGRLLIWMAVVAVVFRPIVFGLHDVLINQAVIPTFTNIVRWQTHRYVLRQSLGFFQNDFAGRIANKIMQTGPALRESIVQVVDALWFVSIYTLSAAVLFVQADWRLAIPLTIWVIALAGVLAYFVPRIKDRAAIMSEARSMLTGRIVDSYTNIHTVKLFAHADREDSYARAAIQEHTDRFRDQMRMTTWLEVSIIAINGLLIAGTAGLALALWGAGTITVGAIALAVGLVIRINNLAGWIMWVVTSIFENIGTVQEGMETISRTYDVVDKPNAPALKVERGEIVFEDVGFHYGKGGGIIENLNLRIEAGEKVGLVGRSGAGKSTLVNLLLRFYDVETGRILIDGRNIAEVTQESLRAQISMVTQDTSLLHRSVMDNIIYGKPDVPAEAAHKAAAQAHADEFIPDLRDFRGRTGYHAHVGERGVKLSGGQRQRIAIARVLLKDAPILVLDEATSALDSEVEAAIQEQFASLMRGKTVIAIAHRLSTIAAMDRLVIMDKGAIVEEGRHEVLLARGGLYADLWRRQSGGFLAHEAAA